MVAALSACSQQITTFGYRLRKKTNDSTDLKKRIAEIKSLSADLFEKGSFQSTTGSNLNYRLFKPLSNEARKLPLVIVFHGSDAIGNDNMKQLGILAKLFALNTNQNKYPAYILAPQFPSRSSNYTLDKTRNTLSSVAQPCLETSIKLIDSLKQVLNIDEKRIYVVGFSMGASSVINALSSKPGFFAAAISISGIPQFDKATELANTPIWLIHGNADKENPITSDKQFYKELSDGNRIRFWEFDGLAHNNIFSTSILGEEMPAWLFANKLK